MGKMCDPNQNIARLKTTSISYISQLVVSLAKSCASAKADGNSRPIGNAKRAVFEDDRRQDKKIGMKSISPRIGSMQSLPSKT